MSWAIVTSEWLLPNERDNGRRKPLRRPLALSYYSSSALSRASCASA